MVTFTDYCDFKKDLKNYLKKYRTIEDDISVLKKVLAVEPDANPPFSYKISQHCSLVPLIKIKKIASKSFKGKGVNSGFRVVYAYFEKEQKVEFIELYHKNVQANPDENRIRRYIDELNS